MQPHGLCGGPREFMTLATPTGLFAFRKDRGGGFHIGKNLVLVFVQLLQNVVLKGPLKKVELTDGRIQSLEVNVLPTTERIKHPLGLRFEMGLVRKLYDHLSSVRGRLGNILLLRIIRHKPVQKP